MSGSTKDVRAKAVEDLIYELKGRGFAPSEAAEISLVASVTLVQLASSVPREIYLELCAETWDGLAAIDARRGDDGKTH